MCDDAMTIGMRLVTVIDNGAMMVQVQVAMGWCMGEVCDDGATGCRDDAGCQGCGCGTGMRDGCACARARAREDDGCQDVR